MRTPTPGAWDDPDAYAAHAHTGRSLEEAQMTTTPPATPPAPPTSTTPTTPEAVVPLRVGSPDGPPTPLETAHTVQSQVDKPQVRWLISDSQSVARSQYPAGIKPERAVAMAAAALHPQGQQALKAVLSRLRRENANTRAQLRATQAELRATQAELHTLRARLRGGA